MSEIDAKLQEIEATLKVPLSVEASRHINNVLLFHIARLLIQILEELRNKPKPENPQYISAWEFKLASASTAEQLPYVPIPYDHYVAIKAKRGNTGTIYIGRSKLLAEDTGRAYPLAANDVVELKIKRLDEIWVSASVAAEGGNWIVEVEKEPAYG